MKKGVVAVISACVGMISSAVCVGKMMSNQVEEKRNMSDKHLALFLMMNQWVKVKQQGKNLASYFKKNGYQKIAVYGMSYAGETLIDELKDKEIKIAYGIDKNADRIYADIDVVSLDDSLEKVDAIVVTAITFFDEIEEQLREKIDCPIISLEDILYEV